MTGKMIRVMAAVLALSAQAAAAPSPPALPAEPSAMSPAEPLLAQRARTCKQVSSCREAVILWCSGYSRADGDDDGIPCENVCRTKAEVDRIREEIGC
jgi:hypothetical protein